MAQRPNAEVTVTDSVGQLIKEYDLGLYQERLREVAQDAVKEGRAQGIDDTTIIRNAKQDLRNLLTRWKKAELPNAKLGRMQLYQVWGAKCINGNEWLFYPEKDSNDPHVSWVTGDQEVHVKFDSGGQTPVTLYYNAQLGFSRVGRNSGQPTLEQRNEAAEIIRNWGASMRTQANQQKAIDEFLS